MNFAALTKLFAKPSEADSSAALLKALASIDVPALEAKVLGLEAQRRTALLSASDAEIAALDDEIRTANIAADRAVAAREELERRIEAARQRETASAVEAKRVHAEALSSAAIDEINTTMRSAFADIRRVLGLVLEAEAAVEAINADLPVDRHVVGPEAWRNSTGGGSDTVLSRKIVSCWTYESNGNRIGEREARTIIDQGDGRGLLPSVGGPVSGTVNLPAGGQLVSNIPVIRRKFYEVTFLPTVSIDWLGALTGTIKLPPLRGGEPAGWDDRGRNSTFNEGRETLQELIARIDRESARGPADDRKPQVRYEPCADASESDEREAA